ncbi:hypothetical protein DVR12_20630 [Chitinophaga silvatica]|uniref:Uncharacterized protein n=1 Tax=Chitinophaga silvatica TaxID=2282649 RepID=A0A3E1Y5X3_9BACT|nr:hypothetical protein [Chitinophaga silvatica]RFS20125.1 hypothetical protein DVR12_20630 [Chitinophaga silvatica]
MAKEELLTFKRFQTQEQAADVISLLQEHNIPVKYEEEVVLMDRVFVGQNYDQKHLVKIPASYFSKADTLLKSLTTVSLDDVEPDYYLLSFSTEELKEVIIKKDEWGDYDYALALKLLEKQGISYTAEQLETLGSSRLETISKPKDIPGILMLVGFFAPLLIFVPAFFGGYLSFLGFFIGGFVCLTKKTLPDGSRTYSFSKSSRTLGLLMIAFNVVFSAICWYYFIEFMERHQ